MNKLPIKATKVFYKNRDSKAQIVINRGGSRSSKCLAKGTEVVMFDGYLKKVEAVEVGDKVMGIDSSPRTVTELHQGIGNLYLISQNKGIDYVAEEDHLLALKERYGKNSKKTRYLNISIRDYLQKSNKFFRRSFGYKNQQPIEFLEKYIPKIEPYLLGLWIADGRKDRFCFSVNYKDVEIADSIYTLASEKYRISIGNVQNQCRDLLLVGDGCKNYYVEVLKELGIHNNKHIPLSLRQMSVKNRLEFLAGYIDGDGYLLKGNTVCYSVCSSNFMIIEGIKFIGHSLGFSVQYKLRERFDKRTQKNYKSHELIIGGDIERIPVRLSRKKIEGKSRKHDWNISSLKVTPHGIGEYYGFSLDGDGLFLLKDFTVVHNSFSISQLLFLERFFTQKNKKFLVLRKTLPSLRLSVYQDFKNFVNTYNLEGIIEENKQFLDYYYKPNNNYLHFGSLDDPEKIKCFHPDTDILSVDGWKSVKDIKLGDNILSINPVNGETCYTPVTNIFVYDYNGKIITTYRNNKTRPITRFCVTPEHKMLLRSSNRISCSLKGKNKLKLKKISDIFSNGAGTHSVPRIFGYIHGNIVDYYDIPRFNSTYYKENGKQPTKFPIISWLKFLGWYLAEGSFSIKYGKKYYAYISQSLLKGREKIEVDLKDFPVHYVKDKLGFKFNSKDLANYVSQFGKCDEKFIPRDIMNLHPSLLKYLFECLIDGDGHRKSNGSIRYTTTSLQLARDMVELGVKLQYCSSYYFTHKTKKGKNCYAVFFNKKEFSSIQNLKEIDYNGKVYCIETAPFHTVVSMYDGCPIGIGQSSSFNYIWMNEATDFDEDDFLQLLLRLSEPTIEGQRNQLFMCFNPIDEYHWIKTKVLDKKEIYDLEEIHSTYKDNPFLSEDYKKLVESYLHIDFNKYKVYALGEWGKLENLIYTNWDTTSEYVNNGEIIYGLDFGFTNPSALLKLVINDKDIFEEEIIYQTDLTNSQLIEKCNELGVSKTFPIYGDSAEPDRIQEFREAGYNVIESVKDVLNSIDFVKRFKIHCYKPSLNLIKEKMGYSRRKDKNGRIYEEPAPNIADHLMNCEQYAIFTHLRHRYFEVKMRFI